MTLSNCPSPRLARRKSMTGVPTKWRWTRWSASWFDRSMPICMQSRVSPADCPEKRPMSTCMLFDRLLEFILESTNSISW